MSFDTLEERDNIRARLKTLAGGRVYSNGVTDDDQIESSEFGGVRPYIMVFWGSLYAAAGDRTIMDEDQQGQIFPVTVECWSSDPDSTEKLAGAVRRLMLAWAPSETNATTFTFAGGGSYTRKNSEGKPTRFNETVMLETVINQSPTIGNE